MLPGLRVKIIPILYLNKEEIDSSKVKVDRLIRAQIISHRLILIKLAAKLKASQLSTSFEVVLKSQFNQTTISLPNLTTLISAIIIKTVLATAQILDLRLLMRQFLI